ncbi:MAG: GLUG motif-containing protein, partial [Oscillospiraceae bacterium]
TLTITDEMMADGKLTLTGGSIPLTVMGASDMLTGGGHRILTDNGISTNFNACAVSGDFCTLPDIVLKAAGRQTYDITLSGLPDDAEIVLIDGDRKPVAADAGNPLSFKALPYGVYDYEILAPGKKMLRGSFEVSSAAGMGTRTITLTMETIATGAWDGKTITEPVKVTAAESGVTGGDFAGQEGYYKITSGAELSWLAIEPWMMTLNANQRIYARDADYVEKVLQKKTSQHTELVSYFDGEMHYPSLSNTEISSLAKAYEHRTPSVARHAVLANDIDLSEFAWTPIGTESNPYTAVFDGNGKTIRGFYIKSTSACQGLFGEICKATVAHLTLIGSIESSAATVGGVAGKARESTLAAIDCQVEITMTSATTNQRNAVGGLVGDLVNGPSRISNCSFTGSISNGYQQVGGLVGQSMNAKITGCVNRGVINGTQKVGGLVGYDNGSMIQDSFNYGAVEVTGSMGGGLAGYVSGTTISDSANSGTVSANASANSGTVGGLVGIARGASCLTRVENSGVVSATGGQVGGIAGSVQSEDKTTYSILHQVANRGAVTGGGDRVGGVVGYNKGCVVKNGYNNAPVTNTGKGALSTGGIVGMSEYNPWGAASVIVENVYNAGAVNAHNTTAVGAVVGDIVGTQGTAPLKNAYYLVSTAAVAVGDQKEADAISKTPDALKALAPALGSWFKAAADGENDGYPVFETLQRPVVMESYDPDIWLTSYPTVVATLAKECEGILEMQINEGKYAQGSSFTPESDGSYTVSFRAKYGEKFSAETTVRFKVDTAAPTGTICFTQAQNQVSAGVITVMPTDTGSGIASITVTGPEGYSQTKTAAPWEFAVVKAGTYIAKVTDQVNQVSTAISQNVAFVSLTGLTIAKADGETSTATLSNGVLRLTICLNATDTVFALKAVALSPIEQEIHTVTWHSSNDAIASISTTGMVTAHQTGLVTITATAMGTQASLMVKSTKKISGTANDGIATTVNPAAELNSLITNTLPKPESTTLTAAQKMQLAVVTEAVQQMDEHAQQGMSNEALAALDVLLKTASQIQPQCSKQTASGVTLTKKQEIPAAPQAVGLLAAAGVTGTDSNPQTVELSMTQLAPIATAPLSFSLKLMVQGESKQLKAPMIMTVQVPQDYVYSNSHSIRHVKNDGSVEWLSFHFDSAARTISFRVGSFSDFIMMSRPTGGSTSGVGDGDNHDNFWKEVRQAITVAADGIIIKADAAGMNDVPASVIELLTGKNVTLVIATGDKDIVINGLSTPKVEAHRIYFTFAQLTELVKNHVQTSSTAGAAPNLSASNASVVTAKP